MCNEIKSHIVSVLVVRKALNALQNGTWEVARVNLRQLSKSAVSDHSRPIRPSPFPLLPNKRSTPLKIVFKLSGSSGFVQRSPRNESSLYPHKHWHVPNRHSAKFGHCFVRKQRSFSFALARHMLATATSSS